MNNSNSSKFVFGQIVKFKSPSEGEKDQRFLVIEDRDDRVYVKYICEMPIPPQYVYSKSDLVLSHN